MKARGGVQVEDNRRQARHGNKHMQRCATVLVIKWQTRNHSRLRNVRALADLCSDPASNTLSEPHTHTLTHRAQPMPQQRSNNKLITSKIKYAYSPHSFRFINLTFTYHRGRTHTHTRQETLIKNRQICCHLVAASAAA